MDIQLYIAIASVIASTVFWFRSYVRSAYEHEQSVRRILDLLLTQTQVIENLADNLTLLRDHVIELKSRVNAKTL